MRGWLLLAGAVALAACDRTAVVEPTTAAMPQVESVFTFDILTGQSPIDIVSTALTRADGRLPRLRFDYSSQVDLHVVNTGAPEEEATIRADVDAGAGELRIGGEVFDLLQFHWHTPSEHTINGEYFPLEMHLVHRRDDGSLAVVGVLVRDGTFNRALADLFHDLPHEEDEEREIHRFNLNRLVPHPGHTYRYSGSLTTPPFTEGVSWLVMTDPIEMSREQIRNFTTLFPEGNSRLAQPLNGRSVWTDLPAGRR